MSLSRLFLLLCVIGAAAFFYGDPRDPPPRHNDLERTACCLALAHAGGEIEGVAYTNSREALDRSYARGLRIFELDFLLTSDGALALAHDWNAFGGRPPSRDAFLQSRVAGRFSPMMLDDLVRWLEVHDDVTVVTDTKGDFAPVIEALLSRVGEDRFRRRFVVQVYSLEDAERLQRTLPGMRMILTVYKLPDVDGALFSAFLAYPEAVAVTFPARRADAVLPFLDEGAGTHILAHGHPSEINDPKLQRRLANRGVTGFYVE